MKPENDENSIADELNGIALDTVHEVQKSKKLIPLMEPENDENSIADELNGIALDTVHEVRKNKKLIPMILGTLCVISILFFCIEIVPLIGSAKAAGQAVGEASGHTAGTAVGSVDGFREGIPSGYEEGKADGLSASDTEAKIATTIENDAKSMGSISVLVANVDLTTFHEEGKKYEALYLSRGSAVFTIDLNEMNVTFKKGLVSIILPKPKAEIRIDPSETKKIVDWQSKYFNGTDSEGFEAYLNTFKAIETVSEDEVANYSELQEQASASAVKQVEEIANAARGNNDIEVTVSIQSN